MYNSLNFYNMKIQVIFLTFFVSIVACNKEDDDSIANSNSTIQPELNSSQFLNFIGQHGVLTNFGSSESPIFSATGRTGAFKWTPYVTGEDGINRGEVYVFQNKGYQEYFASVIGGSWKKHVSSTSQSGQSIITCEGNGVDCYDHSGSNGYVRILTGY